MGEVEGGDFYGFGIGDAGDTLLTTKFISLFRRSRPIPTLKYLLRHLLLRLNRLKQILPHPNLHTTPMLYRIHLRLRPLPKLLRPVSAAESEGRGSS